jgi:hypothetical protein
MGTIRMLPVLTARCAKPLWRKPSNKGEGKMKQYTIKRRSKSDEDYESMVIRDRETGEDIAEYRLTRGCERSEIAAMRRAIDRHLDQPSATLGNYQW